MQLQTPGGKLRPGLCFENHLKDGVKKGLAKERPQWKNGGYAWEKDHFNHLLRTWVGLGDPGDWHGNRDTVEREDVSSDCSSGDMWPRHWLQGGDFKAKSCSLAKAFIYQEMTTSSESSLEWPPRKKKTLNDPPIGCHQYWLYWNTVKRETIPRFFKHHARSRSSGSLPNSQVYATRALMRHRDARVRGSK